MKTLNLILLVSTLTGCVHRVPVIVPAPKCQPDLAMQACAPPVTIQEGSTYSALLADYQTDRQSLQRCALDQEYLRKAIATCNSIIDEHNQRAAAEPGI
jgi:hypothetical protein